MIQREIKEKIQIALNANPELKDTKGIFLISSRHPELGEWSELMANIEENIDGIKAFLTTKSGISKFGPNIKLLFNSKWSKFLKELTLFRLISKTLK
jgi:DNA mismatch repair ATPase MutS